MRSLSLLTACVALLGICESAAVEKRDLLRDLQAQAISALKAAESNNVGTKRADCTLENASVRKDWENLTPPQRKSYISAVQCLFSTPSKSDPTLVPGARTRYDDFVAQHINQTLTIHRTGNFLSWHRMYMHAYEKALINECGYDGVLPYWNWFTYQSNLKESPVFDGSDTSMGGDGEYVQHNGSVGGGGTVFLPSGEGGGCIKSGPFKNLQINLGPISPTMAGESKVPSPLAHNHRCAKRDLTTYASTSWLTLSNLHNITLGPASHSISLFQDELQGRFTDGVLGLHAAGHFAIGGDAGDFYSSPNDPVFFMHHTMLDYVWWMWQALHPKEAKTVAGTRTFQNRPPSEEATVQDLIETNYLGMERRTVGEMLDTLGGEPLCYIYE